MGLPIGSCQHLVDEKFVVNEKLPDESKAHRSVSQSSQLDGFYAIK